MDNVSSTWASGAVPYSTNYFETWSLSEETVKAAFDSLHKCTKSEEPKRIMKLYNLILVDTKDLEVLDSTQIIARDQSSATASADFDDVDRKKLSTGEQVILVTEVGSFEPYVRPVKIVDSGGTNG